ncbi:hypothetical protein AGLY_010927 [Aphis glycines]|uniref:Uncharacterized protein n=1 Tax=Aphis glycines TaxID=307491 RepID=A0A6G0TCW9_APHGL|nr:hypothetical protein AGLY_010927 [Aphis glycines]
MALEFNELESQTKNISVGSTFKTIEIATKSLSNMALEYNKLEIKTSHYSERVTEIECAKEELKVPKKKRQTMYKRVKRFFNLCIAAKYKSISKHFPVVFKKTRKKQKKSDGKTGIFTENKVPYCDGTLLLWLRCRSVRLSPGTISLSAKVKQLKFSHVCISVAAITTNTLKNDRSNPRSHMAIRYKFAVARTWYIYTEKNNFVIVLLQMDQFVLDILTDLRIPEQSIQEFKDQLIDEEGFKRLT